MKENSHWLEIDDIKKFTNYLRTLVYVNFNSNDAFSLTEEDNQEDNASEQDFDLLLDCDIDDLEENEKDELNNLLELTECITIVKSIAKKLRHKKTKERVYLISSDGVADAIENIQRRMISNMIQTLVSKGYLDSAFDDDKNDFIFWTKTFKEE